MMDDRLHWIDHQYPNNKWTDENLDRLMTFCLLDRAMPYAIVCKAFDTLNSWNVTTRKGFWYKAKIYGNPDAVKNRIIIMLRKVGYRFPEQAGQAIWQFAHNQINLRTVSREELIEGIWGIGYKLASMFLRNSRGKKYAVIDTHLKSWLEEHGCKSTNYKEQEQFFLDWCKSEGRDPYEVDLEIWHERRI